MGAKERSDATLLHVLKFDEVVKMNEISTSKKFLIYLITSNLCLIMLSVNLAACLLFVQFPQLKSSSYT